MDGFRGWVLAVWLRNVVTVSMWPLLLVRADIQAKRLISEPASEEKRRPPAPA